MEHGKTHPVPESPLLSFLDSKPLLFSLYHHAFHCVAPSGSRFWGKGSLFPGKAQALPSCCQLLKLEIWGQYLWNKLVHIPSNKTSVHKAHPRRTNTICSLAHQEGGLPQLFIQVKLGIPQASVLCLQGSHTWPRLVLKCHGWHSSAVSKLYRYMEQ